MISTNWPSIFSSTNLSGGKSACKYAPGTSKTATSLFSCANITNSAISDSTAKVADEASSLGTNLLCLLPSAHVLPFIFPSRFSLMRLIARSARFLSSSDRSSYFTFPTTAISFNCLYSLNRAATARSLNNSIPLDACIWLKHISSNIWFTTVEFICLVVV